MLTEKDYCDYETCVALKELGFNEKCHGYYEPQKRCFNITSIKHSWCNSEVDDIGVIICPTLYEAQKWLREEKKIDVLIQLETKDIHLSSKYYSIYISYMSRFRREFSYISKNFNSYEEALSEGIKEAVKILKNQ